MSWLVWAGITGALGSVSLIAWLAYRLGIKTAQDRTDREVAQVAERQRDIANRPVDSPDTIIKRMRESGL